jgi:protein-disulfide isomerase
MPRRVALFVGLLPAALARAEAVATATSTLLVQPAAEDTPARGPRTAPVVVDFFCNFASASCAVVDKMLGQLGERHPDGLRVVYRPVLLPGADSERVAELTVEAWAQGRFDALDDAVRGGRTVRASELDAAAARAGLDLDAMHAAVATHRHAVTIARNAEWRQRLGAASVALAWNGEPAAADMSAGAFERAYVRAEARARAALAEGVSAGGLYPALVRAAIRARAHTAQRTARVEAAAARARVPTGGTPVRGGAGADVTVVAFADFERPLWRRPDELVARLAALYPGRIRIAYRLFPPTGETAARATAELFACAHLQGRFWELHDAVLSGTPPDRAAEAAGLDLDRWRADRAAGRCAALVDADLAEGRRLGVELAPTLFVNGVKLAGARSIGDVPAVVDGELRPGLLEELTAP